LLGLLLALALALSAPAGAQDLQSELDAKEAQLERAKDQEGVLSTELSRYNDQLDQLAGEVAVLRNREAIVAAELAEVQKRLRFERNHLEVLKGRLSRSLNVLRQRLVAIYRSGEPDVLTVMLESDGFDDLVSRYEYLRRIEEQDASIVGRVRTLRNGSRNTVERIEAARDEIAAKKAELERTRMQLEEREAELDAVRDKKASALDQVRVEIDHVEGDIGDIQDQIQSQIQSASETPTAPLPAGPIQGGSSGFVWPVNGPVVSPYGPRWGRIHEGIDIAVPSGTPIRAVKAGNVILAAVTGGYGNYVCIDHGGGLSSCYAHLSSYASSAGDSVGQGEVIGYVGCTGSCFGDHLHFEIRINGGAVDPLGYL
jgi:murein DD-endopeptidase MepM/ murein hydrolase activator NlpD